VGSNPEVDLHIHKLYLLSRKECNHILPPQMAIKAIIQPFLHCMATF